MESSIQRDIKGRFLKGRKGEIPTEETLNKRRADKNGWWVGDSVKYRGLHMWLRRNFKAPERCQLCNEIKKLDVCNVTGIYNRDFKNWTYFCRKCHLYYDGTINNLRHKN